MAKGGEGQERGEGFGNIFRCWSCESSLVVGNRNVLGGVTTVVVQGQGSTVSWKDTDSVLRVLLTMEL